MKKSSKPNLEQTRRIERKRELARIRKQNQRKRDRLGISSTRRGVTNYVKALLPSGSQLTLGSPQGPLTPWFQDYVFRTVDGNFYEALREGIPIFDAAIRRLISLNGTIKIIGDNADLVAELEDFCLNVPVNDMQKGIHAFSENAQNETFEQGFSLSEFISTKKRDDIDRLVVADSKQIYFRKNDAGRMEPWFRTGNPLTSNYSMPASVIDDILAARYGQSVTFNGVTDTKLALDNKIYFSINNENQNPYGVSIFRSTEFVAQILVTLQNSIKNAAERFGDPMYHAHYKGKAGDGKLEERRLLLANDLKTIISAKRAGRSGDLTTAGGPESEVKIAIIGHEGQLFEYEIPLRHVHEQIVAKTNLAAWMLGLYWSTTERMATLEVEMALADAKIRQFAMLPEYIRLFSNFLKLRGRSWKRVKTSVDKPGDWGIIFESPNVRDLVAQAQAEFLSAQASQMRKYGGSPTVTTQNPATQVPVGAASIDINGIKFPMIAAKSLEVRSLGSADRGVRQLEVKGKCTCGCDHSVHSELQTKYPELTVAKELSRPIPWPELDKFEKEYERELKHDWAELQAKIFSIMGLKLSTDKTASAISKEPFTFGDAERDMILRSLKTFLGYYDIDGPDSAVTWYYGQSYSLGLIQAANFVGKERPLLDILQNNETYTELITDGFSLVRDSATRRIRNDIIMAMEDGVTRGINPREMAAELENLFGAQNSDWERLARTEMAAAAERAKLDEWDARGIDISEAVIVPVHPRCRCSTTVKDDGNGNFSAVFLPAPDACPLCLSMQEGDKSAAAAVAADLFAIRQKGRTAWYREWDLN